MDSESIVRIVLSEEDFQDHSHIDRIYENFKKYSGSENVSEFEEEDYFLKRVLDMSEHFYWEPVPAKFLERFQKSSEISSLLRERGNKVLYSTELSDSEIGKEALRLYNLAILFAPLDSVELALGFEKRAILLERIGYYDLAMEDVQLISKGQIKYPLKSRSAEMLIELQSRCGRAMHLNSSIKKAQFVKRREKERYVNRSLYSFEKTNENVENLSADFAIESNENCGRGIFARKDIEPGNVVMVDEPFVIMLENVLKFDVEHCTACSKPVLNGIPCDCCCFAWFCSQSCKSTALKTFHKYEKYLCYLKSANLLSLKALLAARIIFKAGPDEIYKVYKNQGSGVLEGDGFSPDGIYHAKSYLPMLHLISHKTDCKANAFKALLLTELIYETSGFFERYESDEKFKPFVSSLLLRHMEAIDFNAITLSKLDSTGRIVRYGAGVYPVLCLLNHSCNPNSVLVRNLRLLKTAVINLRPLKKGEQVTFSYHPNFAKESLLERKSWLLNNYKFCCACEACEDRWGPESLTSSVPDSQCERCGKYIMTGQCPACGELDKLIRKGLGLLEGKSEEVMGALKGEEWGRAWEGLKELLKWGEVMGGCQSQWVELTELGKMVIVSLVC